MKRFQVDRQDASSFLHPQRRLSRVMAGIRDQHGRSAVFLVRRRRWRAVEFRAIGGLDEARPPAAEIAAATLKLVL
jgi:hypothetical protein